MDFVENSTPLILHNGTPWWALSLMSQWWETQCVACDPADMLVSHGQCVRLENLAVHLDLHLCFRLKRPKQVTATLKTDIWIPSKNTCKRENGSLLNTHIEGKVNPRLSFRLNSVCVCLYGYISWIPQRVDSFIQQINLYTRVSAKYKLILVR